PGQGQKMQQAKAGGREVAQVVGNGQKPGSQSKPNRGSSPAQNSSSPQQTTPQQDLSQQIKESAAEWGKISPRTRNAVIEGADEQIIDKYRKYVEDYYKGVAVRGAERQ